MEMACSQTVLINESESQHTKVCNEEAAEALMREDYETAISLHEHILERDPQNGLETYHLGYIYGQFGNHTEEISYYEKAIDPTHEGARRYLEEIEGGKP
jgi:tetratricopeptide (TPR) repeat protein